MSAREQSASIKKCNKEERDWQLLKLTTVPFDYFKPGNYFAKMLFINANSVL